MSPNKRSTDNLLRRYLNGALTAPEEAELERRALTDEPLAEAMQGLQAHPEADHESHLARMLQGARSQVQGEVGGAKVRPLRRNYARFAAAASIVLLFVSCALWFLPQWIEMDPGDMAMKTRTEAPVVTEVAAPTGVQPEFDTKADISPITEEPEAETTFSAPSSPASKPKPVPNTTAPQPAKVETPARKRTVAKAKRDQTAQAEGQIAAAEQEERKDEDISAEEEIFAEATPPPAPQVAPAATAMPEPSVAADQTTDLFRTEADMNDDVAGNVGTVGKYLEGSITNENGVPVFSALVRVPGLPLGERTDSNGYFRLQADATTTRLDVSHPDYENETVDLRTRTESLQISLDRKDWQPERPGMTQDGASSIIIIDKKPGYASPLEGYGNLRKRLEADRPADVPKGKVKFSFTVNTDGTLTDFEFRGQPSRATMDYIGGTLVKSSVWEIMQGDEPVRVYMKVVF